MGQDTGVGLGRYIDYGHRRRENRQWKLGQRETSSRRRKEMRGWQDRKGQEIWTSGRKRKGGRWRERKERTGGYGEEKGIGKGGKWEKERKEQRSKCRRKE
jgi:hypothetical protein